MIYYKIEDYIANELEDGFDQYYVRSCEGNYEKCEINNNITVLYTLLKYLSANCTKSLKLIVEYKEQRISYILDVDSDEDIKDCDLISGCHLNIYKGERELKYLNEINITGCIPIKLIEKRRKNLIDDLINFIPNDNFSIEFNITPPSDYEKRKEKLIEYAEKAIEKSNVNNVKEGNIGDKFIKTFIGGENKSFQIRDIYQENLARMCLNELYSILDFCVCKRTNICIKAREDIGNKIKQFILSWVNESTKDNELLILRSNEYVNEQIEVANNIPLLYIASIFAFPMEPTSGINKIRDISFGMPLKYGEKNTIKLGKVIKKSITNNHAEISLNDLTKHAFISGVTGSGKSTTIKYILEQVNNYDIPFLVLEPAKNEYSRLSFVQNLKKYKLGINSEDGFKLNPFYFPPQMHIQTHIDNIKSVFISAFPMYGPMPYILETAIYNIYRKKGWDFITSKTIKKEDIYPTLEDLLYEIEEATNKVGYSDDLQSDVKGALKVRINSLISGAKGNILNCSGSEDVIKKLLNQATVISLDDIGDPQEKVFIMGLIIISIYEFYCSSNIYSQELKHLLVFEEAHRLLENTITQNNQEIADMKGKAIETFNNILSEIRAYGEGIIVADQIPSKLSPDIIKNTNLKIIHRLFAKEDREILGNSIGLNNRQIDELIHLHKGEGIIFHSELENPVKVKIDASKKHYDLTNIDIINKSNEFYVKTQLSLIDNPYFIEDCCRCFKTCMVLQKDEEYFNKLIQQEVYFYTKTKHSIDVSSKIAKKILREENILNNMDFSYMEKIEFMNRVDKNPYNEMLKLSKQFLDEDSFAEEAELFNVFLPKEKYIAQVKENIYSTINSINRKPIFDIDKILKLSKCKRIFYIDDFSEEEKEKFVGFIIQNAFKNEKEILEIYFLGKCEQENSTEEYKEDNIIENKESLNSNNELLLRINESLLKTNEMLGKYEQENSIKEYKENNIIKNKESLSQNNELLLKINESLLKTNEMLGKCEQENSIKRYKEDNIIESKESFSQNNQLLLRINESLSKINELLLRIIENSSKKDYLNIFVIILFIAISIAIILVKL